MRVYQTENHKVQYLDRYKKNRTQELNNNKNADKVTISSKALNIKDIQKELAGLPEIRKEKVQLLKEQIQGGTYQVSARAIASKILNPGLE